MVVANTFYKLQKSILIQQAGINSNALQPDVKISRVSYDCRFSKKIHLKQEMTKKLHF